MISRSLSRRRARRGWVPWVWIAVPIVSPWTDRLFEAVKAEVTCGGWVTSAELDELAAKIRTSAEEQFERFWLNGYVRDDHR